MNQNLCETRHLAMGYDKTPLAQEIGLKLAPGQILTLIGPNGAGKSTLLKTLAGQLAPLGGAVLLDGQDLARYTGTARAQKMALMLPHTRPTELTTCFEFAAAGRIPYTGRLGILSPADRQIVAGALERVGAGALADRDFNCISDGQRQRILLARALCQQPQLILLDEPTSFLDIKGKIELLSILQKLAHEEGLGVIVSLHELDMAQKISDAVVCVAPRAVSGVMTPDAAFAPENIRQLYDLTEEQYTAVFGAPKKPRFEHYVRSGQKLLRCGYTTGTCAALAATGAARLLLTGTVPESISLQTPKGIVVEVAPLFCRRTAAGAECAIEKDGGDDVDVTTGLPVIAAVELRQDPAITLQGGKGVGRVTKPGLDQPVGEAAINHVPRQMIESALRAEAEAAGYPGGFGVTISIQGGEEVLDLGSGSGILSITALLLGAEHATGVDIDPKAEDIARLNAAINQLGSDRFTALTGDVIGDKAMMEKLQKRYDIVLANIVADVIIPLAPAAAGFLTEDSIFICSGILNTRLSEVLAVLEKSGMQILSTQQQDDWCRVTAALA